MATGAVCNEERFAMRCAGGDRAGNHFHLRARHAADADAGDASDVPVQEALLFV